MNILFKISQPILIAIFLLVTLIIILILYFQFNQKNSSKIVEYKTEIDIINPRFIKEKSNNNNLEIIAKKASFLSKNKMFLEGAVKYSSNKFILESDMVNFDQVNFNASSNEKTIFTSNKVSISAEGFEVKNKGDIISFKGKSYIEIK